MKIGYSRVSTTDQHPESQQDALTAAGCNTIFVDHYTGTKSSRPEWDKCREVLREGDSLVITRLDRLARSSKDLQDIAHWLKSEGINLVATEQAINTSTPEGKMFFDILAAFAEFEHGMMRARTMDGLAAARARGKVGGRKPTLSPTQMKNIRRRYEAREGTVAELAADYGVTRQTIYRALQRVQPA